MKSHDKILEAVEVLHDVRLEYDSRTDHDVGEEMKALQILRDQVSRMESFILTPRREVGTPI